MLQRCIRVYMYRPKADQDYVTNAENVKLHEIKANTTQNEA